MNRETWEAGKQQELEFWRQWLRSGKHTGYTDVLRGYLRPLFVGKSEVKIADLGCGAVSLIGSHWHNTKVTVVASDLLADEYLKMGGYDIEKQDMEQLTYEDSSFDIVHCSNALDHCFDPRAAIKEMIRVCKPGGWIYLRHFRNVGKLERYEGLHRWNIEPMITHDCLFWTPTVPYPKRGADMSFHLREIEPGFFTDVREDHDPGYKFVVSRYQKG